MAPWRSTPSNPQYKWDLMISYSWAQQPLAMKLKEKLEQKGFSIWFDTEKMAKYKSMPEAMGDGIANSVAVIMCISPDYEKSERCEQEAQFVSQKNKPRFLIKVAKSYNPKAKWLQFLMGDRLYFEMETQKKLQANFEQLDVAIRCVVVPEMEVPENPPRSNRRKRKSVPNLRKFCKISNSSENLHFARGLFGRKTISLTGSLSELTIQALFDASQFDPDRKEKEEKEEEAAAAAEEEEKEQEIPEKNLKESSTVEQFGTRLSKVLNKIYTVRGIFQPTSDDVTDQTSATRLHLMIKSGKYRTDIPSKKMSTDGNFDDRLYRSRSGSPVPKVSYHIHSRSLGDIDLVGQVSVDIRRPTLVLPEIFGPTTNESAKSHANATTEGCNSQSNRFPGQLSQFIGGCFSTGDLLDL